MFFACKKRKEDTSQKDDANAEKKIDMNKYEDFLFEINDSFRRREEGLNLSVHETNSIRFEMTTEDDEKLELESVIRIDDINTLDLPTLYFKLNDKAQVIDYYDDDCERTNEDNFNRRRTTASTIMTTTAASSRAEKSGKSMETAKSLLRVNDMTIESAEKYELLSRRTPFTFEMNIKKAAEGEGEEKEAVEAKRGKSESKSSIRLLPCKLPVMFFWLNKPIEFVQHKNTGTKFF